ncbi:carboxylic ester hydrolase [Aureococcus anophagefferens]|nr:carboxylic ester hydrolase [Aureococcus anophagefferens]
MESAEILGEPRRSTPTPSCASERCDSFRYVGQRVLHSGIAEIPALYPFPPAASEREAYDGRAGP